ncbi:MAG: toxic anion resistance protein [Lachnospiraceae bacterium]|nr:toxic anion resistance protein [Lachnospiraceae bacterium]
MINLTLDGVEEAQESTAPVSQPPAEVTVEAQIDEIKKQVEALTPEEQKQVDEFSAKIDLHDATLISRYGESARTKATSFADEALKGVRGKDAGEIGKLLTQLTVQVKKCDPGDPGGFKLLKTAKRKAEEIKVQYGKVSAAIDEIGKELDGQRMKLLVDIDKLDRMYDENLEYYKELTMYILAGKQKLKETEEGELRELHRKAQETGSQEDAWAYQDLQEKCRQFEKQLYDMELTRTTCMQLAPQIRMVQRTDQEMARSLYTSSTDTISLWKRRVSLALAMENSRAAIDMQRAVSDMTNKMMREQSAALKMNAIDAARESEKGIIDIETLKQANTDIITMIDEVIKIQDEGRARRRNAEAELQNIEDELKNKLIGVQKDKI